jgi:hypothetical protein
MPTAPAYIGCSQPKRLALAQTHARSSPVFCDELYSGLLERGFNLRQRIEPNFKFAFHRLYSLNRFQRDVSSLGQFGLPKTQYCTSAANLT